MSVYFADTSYYIALLLAHDINHANAVRLAATADRAIVTTDHVILELTAYLARPPARAAVVALVDRLRASTTVKVVRAQDQLFDDGWDLYRRHADKGWSLTDCISLVVMREQNLTEVLTTDHHFEQVGFTALLKP
jgi:uncharacterized protein